MKFRHDLTYDAAPDAVWEMLSDPVFREQVCEAQHAHDWDVTIHSKGEGMAVSVDQKRPTDGIPSFAHKFVGEEIHIAQTEDWSDRRSAALDVAIPGKPGHLKGSITLSGDGERTVETVEGEIKVHLPLIGGKLEKLIAELLEHALAAEERVGRTWLAD